MPVTNIKVNSSNQFKQNGVIPVARNQAIKWAGPWTNLFVNNTTRTVRDHAGLQWSCLDAEYKLYIVKDKGFY